MSATPSNHGNIVCLNGVVSPYMRSAMPPVSMALNPLGYVNNYLLGRGYTLVPAIMGNSVSKDQTYTFGLIRRTAESTNLYFKNRIHHIVIYGWPGVTGTVTIDEGRRETIKAYTIQNNWLSVLRVVQELDITDISYPDITVNSTSASLASILNYACYEMPRAVISQAENNGIDMNALSTGMPLYYDASEQQSIARLFDDDTVNAPRRVLFNWSSVYGDSSHEKYVSCDTTSPIGGFTSNFPLMVRAPYGETTRNVSWKFRGSAPSGIVMTCRVFNSSTGAYRTLTITGTGIANAIWSSVDTALSIPTEDLTTADGYRSATNYDHHVLIYSGTAGQEVRLHGITIAEV